MRICRSSAAILSDVSAAPDSFDTFADLVRSRRTHMLVDRDRRVPSETIDRLCPLATWAPNHKKTWPWRFAVVDRRCQAAAGRGLRGRHGRPRLRRRGQAHQDPHQVRPHAQRAGRRLRSRSQADDPRREPRRSRRRHPDAAARRHRRGHRHLLVDAAADRFAAGPGVVRLRTRRSHRRVDLPGMAVDVADAPARPPVEVRHVS